MVLARAKEVGWFAFANLFWPGKARYREGSGLKSWNNRTRPAGNVPADRMSAAVTSLEALARTLEASAPDDGLPA